MSFVPNKGKNVFLILIRNLVLSVRYCQQLGVPGEPVGAIKKSSLSSSVRFSVRPMLLMPRFFSPQRVVGIHEDVSIDRLFSRSRIQLNSPVSFPPLPTFRSWRREYVWFSSAKRRTVSI